MDTTCDSNVKNNLKNPMTERVFLEPIGLLRPSAWGATRLATAIENIVQREGPQIVSVDSDGETRATPTNHPFSESLAKQYGDCIVGTYNQQATAGIILEDLVEFAQQMKRAA